MVEIDADEPETAGIALRGSSCLRNRTWKRYRAATIIVLAVKPQQMQEVAEQLGSQLSAGQIVLSIAAGIRLTDLARWLGYQNTVARLQHRFVLVRAMPNTPALIGAGMTGLYSFPPQSLTRQREQASRQS